MAYEGKLFKLLKKWTNDEMVGFSSTLQSSSFSLQDDSMKKLLSGRNEDIWLFLVTHVFSRPTVRKIRSLLRQHVNSSAENVESDAKRRYISKKDVLTHQLRFLSSRKMFLEKQVFDSEKEIVSLNDKCHSLQRDVGRGANALAALTEAEHLLREKVAFHRDTKKSLWYTSDCNRKKGFNCSLSPMPFDAMTSGDFRPHFTFPNKPETVVSHVSSVYADVQNMLTDLCRFYRQIMENVDIDVVSRKQELKGDIGNILATHSIQHIYFSLQQLSQQMATILESCFSLKQQNFNLQIQKPNLDAANSAKLSGDNELQKMKLSQLENYMAIQQLLLIRSRHQESSNLALSECKDQIIVKTDDSQFGAQLFEMHLQIHVIGCHCKKLKEMIMHLKGVEEGIKLDTSKESKMDETVNLHELISSTRDALCQILYQNKTLLYNLDKTGFYHQCVENLQTEKTTLAQYSSKLSYTIHLEKDRSAKCRSVYTIGPRENKADGTLLLSFENDTAALEKCCKIVQHPSKSTVASRQKVLEKMKLSHEGLQAKNVPLLEISSYVLEPTASIAFVEAQVSKQKDSIFDELQSVLQNWWEQPAQFIPKIMVGKMTLKEWKNCVSAL